MENTDEIKLNEKTKQSTRFELTQKRLKRKKQTESELNKSISRSVNMNKSEYSGNRSYFQDNLADPNAKGVYVSVSGYIKDAEIFSGDGVNVKYGIMSGTDWEVLGVSY